MTGRRRLLGAALAFLALLLAPATATAEAPTFTAEEEAFLDARGPVRVVLGPTGPPYVFEGADGRLRGLNLDLLALMTVRTGVEFEPVVADDWAVANAMLADGAVDVLMPAVQNPEREAAEEFTDPYVWSRFGFWVDGRHPAVHAPADLAGKRVALIASPTHRATVLGNVTDPVLVEVPNVLEGVRKLAAGEVDALYGGYANVGYYARNLGITDFRQVGEPSIAEVRMSVRDEDRVLHGILQKSLASVTPDERLALYAKWTGLDLGPPREPAGWVLPAAAKWGFGGGLALLVLFVVWTATLRREVAARTAELAAAHARLGADLERASEIKRLQEIDRFKTDFLNTASHELNTPLTPLQVQTHLLKTGAYGAMNERQARAVEILERNLGRLGALVQDMLEVARLESRRVRLKREPTDLAALARDAVESFDGPASLAKVEVRLVAERVVADADPQRVAQVLFNLLSNAIRFSTEGGVVRVEVAREGDGARIAVADDGVGLTEEQRARLFQPFSQVHAGQKTGSGLGLYITKGLVERHGGRVGCASAGPGKGATFWVWLPLAAPADEATARPSGSVPA